MPELLALQATMESATPRTNGEPLAVGFAVVAALLALLLRRKWPAGVAEGVFVGGVGVAAWVLLAIGDAARIGHVLVGLSITFYALSRFDAYRAAREPTRSAHATNEEAARRLVLAGAALATGVASLAHAAALLMSDAAVMHAAARIDLAVLGVLAVAIALFRTARAGVYPVVALLGFAVFEVLPTVEPIRAPIVGLFGGATHAWWVLGVSGAALAIAVALVLARWRMRQVAGRESPARLLEPPGTHPVWSSVVLLLAIAAGVGTWFAMPHGLLPIAAGLTALAVGSIAHRTRWRVADELALLATAAVAWCVVTCWWRADALGLLIATGIATGYLLWLANFWTQQLHDGTAWTTTGRFVAIARRQAQAWAWIGAGCAALLSQAVVCDCLWVAIGAGLVWLIVLGMFVRDAAGAESGASGLAAVAAVVPLAAAILQVYPLLAGEALPAVAALFGAATLLALRVSLARLRGPGGVVVHGMLCGALPVVVLGWLSLTPMSREMVAPAVLAGGAVLVGYMSLLRFGRPREEAGTL